MRATRPRHDTGRGHDDASSTHTASPLLAYLRGPRCPLALLPALVPLALAARGGGSRYLICHCPPSAISRSKTQWSSTEYGSSAVPRPPTCGGGGACGRSAEGARPRLCYPLASPTSLGEATVHYTGHAPCVPSRPRSPRRACRGRVAVRCACVWGCVRRCDGRSSSGGPCLWCGGTRRLHLMPHVTCTYRRSTWLALCANRTCFTLARTSCASQVCRSPDGRDSILSCSAA